MSVVVEVQNVPDETFLKLKARADRARMSISEYLLGEIERLLEVPTHEELLERLRSHGSVELQESVVDILEEERERR